MRRELEKIALYLAAGTDRQRQVAAADLAALGAATHEEDVSDCINVALGGKVRVLPDMLAMAEAEIGRASVGQAGSSKCRFRRSTHHYNKNPLTHSVSPNSSTL